MKAFFQISKVDEEKRLVYGRATQEVVDRAGEVLDYETTKPNIEAWSAEQSEATGGKSLGNIRAMHKDIAAGKVVGLDFDDAAKAVDITAKITDDAEWSKVLDGTYAGFSIGGSYVKRWADPSITTAAGKPATRYTAKLAEISLVDRPCVPTAGFFDVVKADGSTETRAFVAQEENMDENVKKGLWEGKRFLDLLSESRYLLESLRMEREREKDASPIPEKLEAALAGLAGLAEEYIGEQLAELKAGGALAAASEGEASEPEESEKAAATADLSKAARTGKKAARTALAGHADEMAKMCKAYLDLYKEGEDEDTADKADESGDLSKAAPVDVDDAIRRAVADAVRPFEGLLKNLSAAPAAPAPAAAPVLRSVAKSEDSTLHAPESDELTKAAQSDPLAAIKLAHKNPASAI